MKTGKKSIMNAFIVILWGIMMFNVCNVYAQPDGLISDQVARQKEVENGGTGKYKAIVVSEKSLPNFTVYRPRNVKWAARCEGGTLPLLIWCNGACSDNSFGYQNMLNEIASHGYVVVAIGAFKMTDDERSDGGSSEQQVVEAINWLIKQNRTTTTDYYHSLNINNIALSGHSCGGAQAIANCGNSRVKTLLIMNAGMGGMSMGGASPQSLNNLHCPIIYLTGGTGDVAYGNAEGDYNSISKVPATWADLPTAGHGGTYWYSGGGDFGRLALKWMDWHMKGYTQNSDIFLKPDLTEFPSWKIKSRNYTKDYNEPFYPILSVTDTVFDRNANAETFAFGADISSLTQLESQGKVFYNRRGVKKALMPILKEQGINSVRLRVWVNPSNGNCNTTYVKSLCSKAKAQGFNVMLDLHYSDYWANGGNQYKPAAWKSHDIEALVKDIYNHTYSTVKSIQGSGVNLRWVQIGNEIDNGILWNEGKLQDNLSNFVRLINSAYDAIKAVSPDIQAVLHVAEGQDSEWLTGYFDALQSAGAKWDAIGISAYPKVGSLKPAALIEKTVANVQSLIDRYDKPVMVVETGHYNNRPLESNEFLCDFLKELINVGATGLFYWEPEITDDYDLGAWNILDRTPSIALDAFLGLRHTEVPYVMDIAWSMKPETVLDGSSTIEIPIQIRHIRDRVQKVDLMSNKKVLSTSSEPPYTINWEDPTHGFMAIHALGSATDGLTVSTDTVNVIVGPAANCGVGVKEKEGTTVTAQYWRLTFNESGKYQLIFKYSLKERKTTQLLADGSHLTYLLFKATEGSNSDYVTYDLTVDDPSTITFTLKPITTNAILPTVRSLIAVPLDGQSLPKAEDVTSVGSLDYSGDLTIGIDNGILKVDSPSPIRKVSVYAPSGQLLISTSCEGSKYVGINIVDKKRKGTVLVKVETDAGVFTRNVMTR